MNEKEKQKEQNTTGEFEGQQAEAKKKVEDLEFRFVHNASVSLRIILIGLLLCSLIYPLIVTGLGELFWGDSAQGSLIKQDGKVIGSALIGQSFTEDAYFHPRVSSKEYDGMDSGGQNLGPTNQALTERVKRELEILEKEGINPAQIPVDLVTESGSTLDPHISVKAALIQVPRVSQASGLSEEVLKELIKEHARGKFLGLYGLRRVNVLKLNLAVKRMAEGGQ